MPHIYERIPLRPVRDLSGLPTCDATGIPVGALYGALAEADTGLLRYLDLALVQPARHVLIPIGHARIMATDAPHVKLRAALLAELQEIPPYGHGDTVDDPYESALLEAHGRSFHGERYYAHPGYEHPMLYAGEHPIVVTEPAPSDTEPLQPLSALEHYRIAEDEPDIRGWRFIAGGDQSDGVIRDVIVDVHALKVRYVAIDLKRNSRVALVPIGFLELSEDNETLWAPALTAEDLDALPGYDGGRVQRADEDVIRSMLRDLLKGHRRYNLPDYRADMVDR